MNGFTMFRDGVVMVCNVCMGICLLSFIVNTVGEMRHGRKVALWSDDAERTRALLDAGASPAVAEQLIRGKKINAIRECRIETGLGLKEAKDLVERYERALYRYEPWLRRRAR